MLMLYFCLVNTPIDFDEFYLLYKTSFIYECRHNPLIHYEYGFNAIDVNDMDDYQRSPEILCETEQFREMAEEHFSEKSHELLMDKQYFKKVDALEMFTDYWSYGRSMKSMPMHNLYVPTAHTIMPRPKFKDYDKNDLVAGQTFSHRTKDLHTPQPGSSNLPNTLKPTGLANWTEDVEYR